MDENCLGIKLRQAHKISASLHLPKSGECLDLKLSAVEFYARRRNFTR